LMIYDNFLVGPSIVSGFTFNDYVDDNGETGNTYLGTYWGIWASDPATGSGPIASGTSPAVLAAGALGSTLFTVTGLDIGLSGGEYWLGTGNILDSSALTDRPFVSTTILSGWEQGKVGAWGACPRSSQSQVNRHRQYIRRTAFVNSRCRRRNIA
jgi:hypothetical protein